MEGQEVSPDRVALLLGRRMKKLREACGLSQEKLAQRAQVSRETVRRVEQGLETTTAMIDRLLWAMGFDAEELLNTRVFRGGKPSSSAVGLKAVPGRGTPTQPIQPPLMVSH